MKKTELEETAFFKSGWEKVLMIMKLTFFLIFLGLTGVSASVYSQSKKLTLNVENETIREVFDLIESQSEFVFIYKKNVIDPTRKVNLKVDELTIEKVLDKLFTNSDIKYEILNRQIILTPNRSVKTKPVDIHSVLQLEQPQQKEITGKVTDTGNLPLPGVSVIVKGTTIGTVTNTDGEFSLNIPLNAETLQFSFVGMRTQEVAMEGKTTFTVVMEEETVGLEEVVVVGYGIQKKSDITGTIVSLPQERLEMVPNINIAQTLQGALSGVLVQTSSAGAESSESIMIRGRNSIKASNSPLVIVDGIAGALNDLSPNDVKSIEILKDASAAAIYGSRGSNGVILITTKSGNDGKTKLRYNGFYSMQRFIKIPDIMNGEEFYNFKMDREPSTITPSELAVYESGEWVDWLSLALRNGKSTEHNLSLSGGFKDTQFYISGNITNIKGLAINDEYLKLTSRINLDTKVKKWLNIGTRTQLKYTDAGGIAPEWDGTHGVFWFNPLTSVYDENGDLTIYPWPDDTYFHNPFQGTLAKNIDETYQIVSNNFAIFDFPFLKGLQYRINAGVRLQFSNQATYYGRDTETGLSNRGDADIRRGLSRNIVIENIGNYTKEFDKHRVFITGLYSFENIRSSTNRLSAQGFPNDFLAWFGASQAELIMPNFSNNETSLLSTMGRINYSYDNRYLFTITGRSDGYSGFGAKTKRGFFPSMAIGWNVINENLFMWKDFFSQLKLRASLGVNGNQAVDAYETISRMSAENMVTGSNTLPGFIPSKLGQDNLGWESTKTLNIGLDFGVLKNRITGEIDLFKSNTTNLLLDRTISPVSAFTSITQNIGEIENRGLDISFISTNVFSQKFKWETNGNISFVKNKIISLYGYKDENGKEIDDIANSWFIGNPIRVNYGFLWDGVWQLDEADEATLHGSQPGYIKIKDISGPDGVPDGILSPEYDRIIIGQRDPKYIWGLTNSFLYKNFTFRVFAHGIHGVTKRNTLMTDDEVGRTVRNTTIKKNWWRPDNPTNDWFMNATDANRQEGYNAHPYEKAGFIRIKDVSLAYDFSKDILSRFGFSKFQLYVTGRNLFTFTKFGGLDPELSSQQGIPMQKEYVFGINLEF